MSLPAEAAGAELRTRALNFWTNLNDNREGIFRKLGDVSELYFGHQDKFPPIVPSKCTGIHQCSWRQHLSEGRLFAAGL